jgi:hypothetical protein
LTSTPGRGSTTAARRARSRAPSASSVRSAVCLWPVRGGVRGRARPPPGRCQGRRPLPMGDSKALTSDPRPSLWRFSRLSFAVRGGRGRGSRDGPSSPRSSSPHRRSPWYSLVTGVSPSRLCHNVGCPPGTAWSTGGEHLAGVGGQPAWRLPPLRVPSLLLDCSTGTGTGTGDPVPGSPDPVVNNARWRPLGSQDENKTRKNYF